MAFGDRVVDGIGVTEVVCIPDGSSSEGLSLQAWQHGLEPVIEPMGSRAVHGFVVMTGVVVPPKAFPMIRHDLGDAALSFGQDLQPEQDGPKPIFLAHMVAASAKAFLSAEGDLPGVEQIAEELPTGWCFIAIDAQLLGHHIHSSACGHRAGHPC